MAFRIDAPKYWPLMPFFILLVIVLAPFALFFGLVRMPFAKRRVTKLNEIIANDWLPRQKYVYIGYSDGLALTEYIDNDIISKYGSHIIFDKWLTVSNEWTENEPDTYQRVTTVWQDIAGDFDGDPLLIVAVLTPDHTTITESMPKVYYFDDSEEGYARLVTQAVPLEDVKSQIDRDIKASINSWKSKQAS